jgi:GNAT superfamily N-acetyltransferase
MAAGVEVTVTAVPDAADIAAVKAALVSFNTRVADDDTTPLGVFARRNGVLVAGATGITHWGWLFVEYLWVTDDLRGGGLGTRLLRDAEAAARARGCTAVWLDTFSFQAPRFYERLGYRQFGHLHDYPAGGARHFLWKPL